MEEALLKTIREITARKESEGTAPTYTTRLELERAVSDALNRLYANGEIQVGRTANDKWIKARE